ncbi:zinc finger matrin-type protein 5 isoform X3 [Anolis sagrei]|uniref:zinc finger matrin-type protein 5 isoform X3 n=1 Tax=Anolis sagrei TaxID=38937 RepID=UPI0035230AF5
MTASGMRLLSCRRSRTRSPAGSSSKQVSATLAPIAASPTWWRLICRRWRSMSEGKERGPSFSSSSLDLVSSFFSSAEEKRAADRQSDTETARPPGNIEDWLEKRVKRLRATETKSSLPEEEVAFQQPLGWPPEHSLPPSLRAPPLGGWAVPRDLHWG